MDSSVIINCIAGTLEPSLEVRTTAEQQLRQLSHTPGFLGSCLDILINSNTPEGLKKATAVYFKNRIVRSWKANKDFPIDHDEKPIVLERIIPVIVQSDYHIKQQLIPVLRVLITVEYDKWTQLLPNVAQLLQGETREEIYAGMICFSEIARKFKWAENRDRKELDQINEQVFPHLLTMGKSLIKSEMNEFSAEILKLILKVYKFVTYYDLPVSLQSRDSIIAWGEFHAEVINMEPPNYVHNSSLSEQEKSMLQISKCYKWAISNLYRLFTKYASKSLSRKFYYTEFHQLFLNEFMPHFIGNFLTIIEQYCQGKRWLSTTSLFKLLEFLSHCVVEKSTWILIKPYYETLISHLIYPLLCPSDDSLELYDEDPAEYIHLYFDPNYDYDSPEKAALALLVTFVYKRKKTTLVPIVAFIHQQVNSLKDQPETLEVAKKREGALRMLGSISGDLIRGGEESDIGEFRDQLEPFLAMFVIPNLTSKYGFLQARALEVVAQFADIEFNSEATLSALYHGILKNFDESKQHEISLPVVFESALSLQAFLVRDDFKQVLAGLILPTMSKLLELSNDIDTDAISMVMQECVENFSEQLQPFGVDLMTKLVSQFMRLAIELKEAANVEVDEIDDGFDDQGDKLMAALGFLNTMITVLLSFENSREVCIKLEEIFSEAISYVLVHELDDFLAEVGELMENSTFLTRSISPVMWQQFKLLYLSFEQGVALMYVEELIQCLQNFLIYGREELQHNQELSGMFFKIFVLIVGCDDTAYNELVNAFELAQTFILVLEHQAKPYIPEIIQQVLQKYNQEGGKKPGRLLATNSNNVLIASLVYDTETTMVLLQQSGKLFVFFNDWFASIPKLARVYDLKLTVLGLLSLGGIELDESILVEISRCLILALKKLPSAMENLESKRRNFNELSQQQRAEFDENEVLIGQVDFGNEADDEGEEEEEEEEKESDTDKYLRFLNNEDIKLSGYFDETSEELYEDPLVSTALDGMNIFTYVKQFIDSINGSARFNLMFGDLQEEDKQVIIRIMEGV